MVKYEEKKSETSHWSSTLLCCQYFIASKYSFLRTLSSLLLCAIYSSIGNRMTYKDIEPAGEYDKTAEPQHHVRKVRLQRRRVRQLVLYSQRGQTLRVCTRGTFESASATKIKSDAGVRTCEMPCTFMAHLTRSEHMPITIHTASVDEAVRLDSQPKTVLAPLSSDMYARNMKALWNTTQTYGMPQREVFRKNAGARPSSASA